MRSCIAAHPNLAALSRPSYVQLSGYAQAASTSISLLEGRSHLVVPVVAMVAGSIVQGLNSRGPEYVPAEVLANFPESFNGRPIVPIHPYDGTGSANEPATQNKYRYGQVFNARTDGFDGNLKLDAWLDIERAAALGGDPASVVADCQAGRLVQVSLGAWIVMAEEDGETDDGRTYSYVWQYITSYDHLAMGLAGDEGACSVEMGCGAPRMNAAGRKPTIALSGMPLLVAESKPALLPLPGLLSPVLRANALAKARRPTFSGTETTTWSSPSWHEWVTALHTGNESPKSIADATDALKASIARHTLLGDPNATMLRDLTLFPVVNPHSGRLNERALRGVLGGRGSAADIPDTAKTSAQEMARALLKSEFGVDVSEAESEDAKSVTGSEADANAADTNANAEESNNSKPVEPVTMAVPDPKNKPKKASSGSGSGSGDDGSSGTGNPNRFARAMSVLASVFRANGGSTDTTSDSELRAALWNELRASEPAFGWGSYYYGSYDSIIDVYFAESTVVYVTCPYDEVIYWRQTYTVDAAGKVTLNGDREMVTHDYNWKPVAASASEAADPEDDSSTETTDMPAGGMTAASAATTATSPAQPTCSCQKNLSATSASASAPVSAAGEPAAQTETAITNLSLEGDPSPMAATAATNVVKTLVARLIANSGVFTADNIPTLEALPEAQLTAMCEKLAPMPASTTVPAPVPIPAVVPAVVANAAVAQPATAASAPAANAQSAHPAQPAQPESLESLLPRLPADLQAFIASNAAAMEQRKATLLAAIGGKSKATAAMLAANSAVEIPQLEAMAQELGCFTPNPIPSYGAAGLPVTPAAATANSCRPAYKVPKPYDLALNAMGKPGIGKSAVDAHGANGGAKPN